MDGLTKEAREALIADDALLHRTYSERHWHAVDTATRRMADDDTWHPVDSSNTAHDEQSNGHNVPEQTGGRR